MKIPVVLFCYKRLDTVVQTVQSLLNNKGSESIDFFCFSDGPKTSTDVQAVNEVRNYLKTIKGFKSIKVIKSKQNKGLAASIISGVDYIFQSYESIIVLEDDLILSSNFLAFMNGALDYYKNDHSVFSISGFTFPIKCIQNEDVYFTKRASSQGWATWKDGWLNIDWNISDYHQFKRNRTMRNKFNAMGSDMSSLLRRQMNGKINSWAIRWCYHQFKKDLYTVYPAVSKIKNIGYGNGATHTKEYFNRFEAKLDTSGIMKFTFTNPVIDKKVLKHFTSKYSLSTRAKYKVLNTLAAAIKK